MDPNHRDKMCIRDRYICVLRKKYYLHNPAHQNYRKILVETREGVNISEDELVQLDEFVSPLIMKGQSIHHIVANNKDEFSVSEKSLYRYVSEGLLKARNIDMPRVCRLKPVSYTHLEKFTLIQTVIFLLFGLP